MAELDKDLKPVPDPVPPEKDPIKDLKLADPPVPPAMDPITLGKDVEEMLSDGTPKDKVVSIPKDKFDTVNEESKLFKQFEPLLAKLAKNPDVVEKLLDIKDPNEDLATKVARLEADIASKKQQEVKTVLTAALQEWPELKGRWNEVRPIIEGLEKQGYGYADSLERAWFAVNPEAAKKEQKFFIREVEKNMGVFSSGGGGASKPPAVHKEVKSEENYAFNDADEEFIRLMGWGEKERALYQKHAPRIAKFEDL